MHALRHKRIYKHVALVEFFLLHTLFFSVLFKCEIFIYKSFAQSFCTFAALPLMGFVDYYCKIPARKVIEIFICVQKFLYRTYYYALFIINRVHKPARTLFIVYWFDEPGSVLEAVYRILQLTIQHNSVRNHNDRIEYRGVVVAMKRGKAVSYPRNRVRFTTSRRVFYKIAFARTVDLNIGDNLIYHVVLMIAWEDKFLAFDRPYCTAALYLLFFGYENNKFIYQVEQTVALQNLLPKVSRSVSFGVLGIALAARNARTVAALIEGDKVRGFICELRSHIYFVQIDGKVNQKAVIEPETQLPAVAVVLKLKYGVVHILTLELVFKFKSDDGYAVYRKHHINGVVIQL